MQQNLKSQKINLLIDLVQKFGVTLNKEIMSSIEQQIQNLQIDSKNYSQFQELIIELLSDQNLKNSKLVGQKIADYLINIEWFRRNFKSNKKQIIKYIQHFVIKKCQRHDKIINKGAPSLQFYIILKGSVFVIKQIIQQKSRFPKLSNQHIQSSNQLKQPNHQFGLQIPEGNYFGDVGVLFKKKRMATIVANNNCVLLEIEARIFSFISAESTLRIHQKRYKFICQKFSNKIQHFSYQDQQQILLAFQPQIFTFGSLIFKSKNSTEFYMIEEGIVSCYCRQKQRKRVNKVQYLGSGMFIGALDLLKNLKQKDPNESQINYQFYADAEQVKTYSINKQFLIKFLKSHHSLLLEIINRYDCKQKYHQIEERIKIKQKFLCKQIKNKNQQDDQCLSTKVYSKLKKKLLVQSNSFTIRQFHKIRLR